MKITLNQRVTLFSYSGRALLGLALGLAHSGWRRGSAALPRRAMLGAVALALAQGFMAHSATYTWSSGATGSWSDSADWVPSGVPGAGDAAAIASGTVTVTGPVTVGSMFMSGGTLAGNAVTVTGPLYWSGGTIGNTVAFVGGTNGSYCYLDGGQL
ncbi:MAG: hypothetical protein ACRED1_06515, partial [Limisphaerales bacterium]